MGKSIDKLLLTLLSKLTSATSSRYVRRFVPTQETYEPGRHKLTNSREENAVADLLAGIENIKGMVESYPFIKEIKETIFMLVKDLDDLKLTLEIENADATVTIGWKTSKRPTLVLPLYAQNLKNLKEVTSGGKIRLEDVYRFIRVLFIPFLRGLYQADYSNLPKDKSYMQLDNFIQVEVVSSGIEVEGFPGPARATVVNVDGQWLVFEGFQGDPDVRYSMSVREALEFAYLIKLKILKHAATSSILELMPYLNKYNELKKKVQVYERKWHNVVDLKD